MTAREVSYYDTFVTVTGNLHQRIETSTGLKMQDLQQRISEAAKLKAVGLLIENPCSQNCAFCFFTEKKSPETKLSDIYPDPVAIEKIGDEIRGTSPDAFMFYPREITSALNLLPLYRKWGINRILTNGKNLHRPGTMSALKAAGISRMSVTVVGSPEAFHQYTGESGDGYASLLENIQLAVRSGITVSAFTPMFKGNTDCIPRLVEDMCRIGVKDIQFLRDIPVGQAADLDSSTMLDTEDIARFLRDLNSERHKAGSSMRLSLFKGFFGRNFYSRSMFVYMDGNPKYQRRSPYPCTMIDNHFLGVSAVSGDVYACQTALSLPEFRIGKFADGQFEIAGKVSDSETLRTHLSGICSSANCEEQTLCMGGCRLAAYSKSVREGNPDPLNAGQDFCMTDFLKKHVLNNQQAKS